MNVLDVAITYYAFHNNFPVTEIGPLGASNLALAAGLTFSILVAGLCYWILKNYRGAKTLMFKIFTFLIWSWAVIDTMVIVNNVLVIMNARLV